MPFAEDTLFRILRDLVSDELSRTGEPRDPASWSPATALDGEKVGADSLDRTTLATAVNERFRLHEVGTEDFLLAYRTLGDWVGLVREAMREGTGGMAFRTSGTTGPAKLVRHDWAGLRAEMEALGPWFAGVERVIALAPAHHIFGFLFTAALPERWGIPVVDGEAAWATAHSDLGPGDLIVTIPERWRYLISARDAFPTGVSGVSSTAELDAGVFRELRTRGLDRLVEVYGATETGGVGVRTEPGRPFTLLDHWRPTPEDNLRPTGASADRPPTVPMDRLQWTGERQFLPQGRRDGAVQVGGVNVHPAEVAERLRQNEWVAEALVRPMPAGDGGRLEAFIVPSDEAPPKAQARAQLHRWIEATFEPPQRPRALSFVAALPQGGTDSATFG